MLEYLINIDFQVFYFINETLSNSFFDLILPIARNKLVWIPLYLFLLAYIFIRFKLKAFYIIAFTLLTILCSDTLSSKIIKQNIKRLRPCKTDTLIAPANHRISSCAGYSFTSSHATNHFAIAIFLGLFFMVKMRKKLIFWLFLSWAAIIAFAQVYVGVHFPFDVLAGMINGSLLGLLIYYLFDRLLKWRNVELIATGK